MKTINALKILQIIQRSQLRGAELFACQLSEELQKQGHQVDVLVLFGKKSDVFKFDLPFFYLEADEKKRWWDFSSYKKLSLFIKKGKYVFRSEIWLWDCTPLPLRRGTFTTTLFLLKFSLWWLETNP